MVERGVNVGRVMGGVRGEEVEVREEATGVGRGREPSDRRATRRLSCFLVDD